MKRSDGAAAEPAPGVPARRAVPRSTGRTAGRSAHPADGPDLAVLTGVRSGKRSYYTAFVHSDERLQRAVRAMDSISRAVVRTVEGPRGLLEEVVRAAAAHLEADWTLLALVDGSLRGARPRVLVLDADGTIADDTVTATGSRTRLPAEVHGEIVAARTGAVGSGGADPVGGWVRVPMLLEGRPIGVLAGRHRLREAPEEADLSVLRILANQAAVSLHTSEQYQEGVALHRRARLLYDEASDRARDLQARTAELEARTQDLERAEASLLVAGQRELIDTERARIARELHDSVAQHVLSAGMALEVARRDAEQLGGAGEQIAERLAGAKQLTAEAIDQLRRAIYALHQSRHQTLSSLPELITVMAEHYRPALDVAVEVRGEAVTLSPGADHEIARAVAEALFNVATHARAGRVEVLLAFHPERLVVSVCDDGVGDPATLTRLLGLERGATTDGSHRGLANIEARVTGLGGAVRFRRSALGGVCVEADVPLPIAPGTGAGLIDTLITTADQRVTTEAG